MAQALAGTCREIQGGEVMKRKERMEWYIDRICKMLRHLPATQANEIECRALWINVALSNEDIAVKLRKDG